MEDPTMTCNLCDESFNSEHELRDHQQTAHALGVNSRRRSHESELDDEQETAA
jgi:C2H2 type zinc finger protein